MAHSNIFAARPVIQRDAQKSLAYAWERVAFPGFISARPLTPAEARALIARVLGDVVAAGGFADPAPTVKFTKRSGQAIARWGLLNFTPRTISRDLVLHELAHCLTLNYPLLRGASDRLRAAAYDKAKLSPLDQHALRYLCSQGHGPRWVACYIALQERYNGFNADDAVQTAAHFRYQGMGPWRVTQVSVASDGRKRIRKERVPMMKTGSVKVSREALLYWRGLLANIQH